MIQTYLESSFLKMMLRFEILNFGHCYLFVIWVLGFVISILQSTIPNPKSAIFPMPYAFLHYYVRFWATVHPDVAYPCRGKTRQSAPNVGARRLGQGEQYFTVGEILAEASTVRPEPYDSSRCGFTAFGESWKKGWWICLGK